MKATVSQEGWATSLGTYWSKKWRSWCSVRARPDQTSSPTNSINKIRLHISGYPCPFQPPPFFWVRPIWDLPFVFDHSNKKRGEGMHNLWIRWSPINGKIKTYDNQWTAVITSHFDGFNNSFSVRAQPHRNSSAPPLLKDPQNNNLGTLDSPFF